MQNALERACVIHARKVQRYQRRRLAGQLAVSLAVWVPLIVGLRYVPYLITALVLVAILAVVLSPLLALAPVVVLVGRWWRRNHRPQPIIRPSTWRECEPRFSSR